MARIRLIVAVMLALLLGACSTTAPEQVAAPEPEPDPPTASASLAPELSKVSASLEEHVFETAFYSWFDGYTQSRIIELELWDREPQAYGPWTARLEEGTEDAASDGALTQWAENYFIAHDWSDYGQEILTMQPGDIVTVNDRTFTVERVFNYPKASFYEEVKRIAGDDAIIFQTCYPDSVENRIVYGR